MRSPFTLLYRILLGLVFLLLGINQFFNFIPYSINNDEGILLMEGMKAMEYMLPLLGVTYIISGILLLINKAVPFALILIAPIALNIFLYHVFWNPTGLLGPFGLATLLPVILIYKYWPRLRPLLK